MQFKNTWFDELPDFYSAVTPAPLNQGRLLYHNQPLADALQLDAQLFSGSGHPVLRRGGY